MLKRFFISVITLASLVVAIFLSSMPVQAADLKLIEKKVVEKATERQQQGSFQDNPQANTRGQQPVLKQNNDRKELEQTIHWSLFNGIVVSRTIQEQHYLSFFTSN